MRLAFEEWLTLCPYRMKLLYVFYSCKFQIYYLSLSRLIGEGAKNNLASMIVNDNTSWNWKFDWTLFLGRFDYFWAFTYIYMYIHFEDYSVLKFTYENEKNRKISFLYVLLTRTNKTINTSVFTKSTSTENSINFNGLCPDK